VFIDRSSNKTPLLFGDLEAFHLLGLPDPINLTSLRAANTFHFTWYRAQVNVATHTNHRIHNNIVVRCKKGIVIQGTNPDRQNNGVHAFNNTVVDNSSRGITVSRTITDAQVWNNIIVDGSDGDLFSSNPSITFCDYNIYHNVPSGMCGANSQYADPLFVNAANDDYHLQAGTPAKNAGRFGETIGAYATGTEVIGLTNAPLDTVAPAVPTGLFVQ